MLSPLAKRQFSTNMNATVRGLTHLIFGANTDVGKTVITAGLVRACQGSIPGAHYIKPLQCGGSDQNFVRKHAPSQTVSATTLFEWESPTSPHAASRKENLPVSDDEVVTALQNCLDHLRADQPHLPCWIETAGGVLSPSSSSPLNRQSWHATNDAGWGWRTQGDLYSHFKNDMDVVMIGDGRLGGISATLSSLESLLSRGYNVTGLVLIEAGYSNQNAIREYASR
jgi:dethiobiotin synthetase/adenosylmethionine--8-amino-7-oxononanoate aminotransferase